MGQLRGGGHGRAVSGGLSGGKGGEPMMPSATDKKEGEAVSIREGEIWEGKGS